MEVFIVILSLVVAVECFIASMLVLNKTNKIIDRLLELIANFQAVSVSTRVEKEVENEPEKDKSSRMTQEDNLKSAEYSGVLHNFVRNGTKHERPVMVFTYHGKKVFFEYDEAGKPVYLRTKVRENVLEVLEGKKTRNFKLYKVENK